MSITCIVCKHCGGEAVRKFGFVLDRQRYLCKQCERTFREGDSRVKYNKQDILSVQLNTDNNYRNVIAGWKDQRLSDEYNAKAHEIVRYMKYRKKNNRDWGSISQMLSKYDILGSEFLKRNINPKE